MPTVKLQVYNPNKAGFDAELEVQLPTHVNRTGDENHFELAVHDLDMYMRGVRDILRAQQDAIEPKEGAKPLARHKLYAISLRMD